MTQALTNEELKASEDYWKGQLGEAEVTTLTRCQSLEGIFYFQSRDDAIIIPLYWDETKTYILQVSATGKQRILCNDTERGEKVVASCEFPVELNSLYDFHFEVLRFFGDYSTPDIPDRTPYPMAWLWKHGEDHDTDEEPTIIEEL